MLAQQSSHRGFRQILQERFFEGHTLESKLFETFLAFAIIVSVAAVLLETNPSLPNSTHELLIIIEWVFTIVFTLEYLLRAYAAKSRAGYIFGTFGIIDLASILPLYLNLFIGSSELLQLIRVLRLVRVFSRLVNLTHRLSDLSKSAFNLEHHLVRDEQQYLYFRPSRKARFFSYFFGIPLLLVSLTMLMLSISFTGLVSLFASIIAGYCFFITSLVMGVAWIFILL